MFQEKRPTCVTVIGWAWIIIGGLMCFSSTMVLIVSVMIAGAPHADPETAFMFEIFPILAVVQLALAILGLFSGINFLKLKAWARPALEGLTWIILIFILGFTFYFVFDWLSMTSGQELRGFDIMGAVMGVVIMSIYGVPVGIMLKFLRGPKIRDAINGTVGQSQEGPASTAAPIEVFDPSEEKDLNER